MNSMFANKVREISYFHQNSKFYVEKIPENIYKKIHEFYGISENEIVIAFLDNTLFRNGKNGIVFTNLGLKWRDLEQGTDSIYWEELVKLSITKHEKKSKIKLGEIKELDLSTTEYPIDQFINLLNKIVDSINHNHINVEKNSFISRSKIYDICSLFEEKRATSFSVGENLDKRKVNNFLKLIDIDLSDEIIAFLDTTILNSGKSGMAICESGIYFKEKFLTVYFPWFIVKEINFHLDDYNLEIENEELVFHLQNTKMKKDEIFKLIQRLQVEIRKNDLETYM
ncbi:hypothetical protein P4671_26445 [Priestia megaterium]|uniref:hypothetical protein n=1 Tax=Priestia megaterium TaxID=1404 RepID=UPI002E1C09A5|nr:hypothetical protein [Priestia megaterium]